jgi:alpha-L-arabinofuranosidase
VKDNDNWAWWNIGGWGNSRHAIEYRDDGGRGILGDGVQGSVETGRWYDVRVELHEQSVKCYLDGQLVHDVTYEQTPLKSLHAVASRVERSGEIILKVVNVSKRAIATRVDLQGVTGIAPKAEAYVLTSADPKDENSIAEPTKVVPKQKIAEGVGKDFTYEFPANSVTVLRLQGSK